uniref:RNA polymerase I specific transcription initiation factor RRN3, putative n=1 Tax=Theileria annulata TaxID=5874 RepID=A0A3B0NCY7_THEAN
MSKMEMDKYEIMYTPKNKIEMMKGMSSETCYASSDSSFSDTNSAETISLDSSSSFSSQIITNCESSSSIVNSVQTTETGPNALTTENKTGLITNEQKCDTKLTVEKVVKELFEVFEQVILQAYKCKYVQFIYFFIASFDVKWLRMFLQRLFGIVYDNSQHVIKRRTAASYISSLICRAKYVPQNFITSTLTHFFTLLSPFNHFISNNGDSNPSTNTTGIDRTITGTVSNKTSSTVNGIITNGKVVTKKLSLFYSILQDILYIICYHTDVISRSESCVSFIENSETGLMAYLTSYLDPLAYCKRSVISEAIKSTSYYSNLACLHEFLKSKSYLLDNSKESEQFKWSFYSPIDSFFPFDPYLLHHSRFYISDKYNSKPHVPESAMLEDQTRVDSVVTTQQNKVVDEVVDAIKSDKNLVEDDLKRMSRCLDDSLGFSSISRALKAKLDILKRNFSADTTQIEADYDFWNYENTIKLLEDTDNPATISMDQDEMRLCEELGIEVMEDRKHGLLELLTSSSAYKSAITNSKRARLCQTN